MDPMELQRMMAMALRKPQDAGANYPDVSPPQMMQPAPQRVQASMGPVSELDRLPMPEDPQASQDRTSLEAGIQALRMSGLQRTDPAQMDRLRELEMSRDAVARR